MRIVYRRGARSSRHDLQGVDKAGVVGRRRLLPAGETWKYGSSASR